MDKLDYLPRDAKAFPLNYWDGFTPQDSDEFFGLKNGLHANAAETSAVLAINPTLYPNVGYDPRKDFAIEVLALLERLHLGADQHLRLGRLALAHGVRPEPLRLGPGVVEGGHVLRGTLGRADRVRHGASGCGG